MNLHTGREFDWTNPQDDPHLYPPAPDGFDYDRYGNLVAREVDSVENSKSHCAVSQPNARQPDNSVFALRHRPLDYVPSRLTTRVTPHPPRLPPHPPLTAADVMKVVQQGGWLPNAHGPHLVTICDCCGKTNVKRCFNFGSLDICLPCAAMTEQCQ